MARNSLLCADVPLRNYSLTHYTTPAPLIRSRLWRYINLFTYFLTYISYIKVEWLMLFVASSEMLVILALLAAALSVSSVAAAPPGNWIIVGETSEDCFPSESVCSKNGFVGPPCDVNCQMHGKSGGRCVRIPIRDCWKCHCY